jgi:hypothetical protein
MTGPSSEAAPAGENAVTIQADLLASGDAEPAGQAELALPRRAVHTRSPEVPARAAQPLADLDVLRRVLDGLNRL